MDFKKDDIKIISGNSNKTLAQNIARTLGVDLVDVDLDTFSDGEINFKLKESVRGKDVFVVQSTNYPQSENLMELLIIMDALKRASAGRITAIMPYYGYARQDRKSLSRHPITAKLVADLLTTAGADRIVTMDLHADQIQGFFDIPVDHLSGILRLSNHFQEQNLDDLMVVAPDTGSIKRARKLAQNLQCDFAIIDKHRPRPNEAEVKNIIGDVKGKNCIMIDDMIDTGGTIVEGVKALMERGAKSVRVGCTHGVLSGDALKKLDESPIEELVILDTIELPEEKRIDKLKIIPTNEFFGEAITYIHNNEPLSLHFEPTEYV